jgi:hypothetical protein
MVMTSRHTNQQTISKEKSMLHQCLAGLAILARAKRPLALLITAIYAPMSLAWNYFHIGLCNYSSQPMEYQLSFNPFNEFFNPNVFNVPLSGRITYGNCTPATGDKSWSLADNTFIRDHHLSFQLTSSLPNQICFTLINYGVGSPELVYQFDGDDYLAYSWSLPRDKSTDYTLEILQFDDKANPYKISFALRNPTLSDSYILPFTQPTHAKTCLGILN